MSGVTDHAPIDHRFPRRSPSEGRAGFRRPPDELSQGSILCLRLLLMSALLVGPVLRTPASEPAALPLRLVASTEPGWPQFRGPRRDGISEERGLIDTWPESGPPEIWTTEGLGRGYSSPVIAGGRIFITGDADGELRLIALSPEGRRLWEVPHGRSWKDPYPGARASANALERHVYLMNAHGRLAAFDAATGSELWAVDVLGRWGGDAIQWGLSECVAVDAQSVYATVGGRQALAVALDRATGILRWISPPVPSDRPGHSVDGASYVSPVLVEASGRRLLIGCGSRVLFCLDADTGERQWTVPMPTTHSVLAMTPVVAGGGVFMTAPHGRGGRLFEVLPPTAAGGRFGVREAWSNRLDACQGGAVALGDRLYAAYYQGRKGWAAFDLRTGETVHDSPEWTKGSVLAADGRLYALSEDGWVRLLAPGPEGFERLGEFRFVEATARDAWAHPVILGGRLYLRYHERLACLDLRRPLAPASSATGP